MLLKIGDKMPKFTLPDAYGKLFHSDEIIGHKICVIYFYPKDFTPGCAKEACLFRDLYENFKKLGAEVIGISSDSINSHKKFTEHYGLPYTLLSDTQQELRQKLGIKKHLLNLIPGRETFIIDKKGILRYRFRELKALQHPKKALEIVKKLQNEK